MSETEEKEVSILKRQISDLQKEVENLKNENKKLKKENTDIVKCMEALTSYVKLDDLVHNPGLEHIAAQIFKYLDPKSLGQCRAVSKGWKFFIDNDKYWWIQVLEAKSMLRRGFRMVETWDVFANRMIWFPDNNGYSEFENTVAYIKEYESLENLRRLGRLILDYYCCFGEPEDHEKIAFARCRKFFIVDDIFKMQIEESVETPLHFAADNNRLDILNYLASLPTMQHMNLKNVAPLKLSQGHRPHETLLGNAILKNQVEIVEFFMKLRGDKKINFDDTSELHSDFEDINLSGYTLFYLACNSGNIQVIKLFLKHADELNINLNPALPQYRTPLCISIVKPNKKVVELLMNDSRIDVSLFDAFLTLSEECGPIRTNVDQANRRYFEERRERLKLFAMVVNSPRITLEDVDHQGQTIFHVAFEWKDPKIVEVLIKEAIKRNIASSLSVTRNNLGLTAIHCAFNFEDSDYPNTKDRNCIWVILKYSKDAKIDLEARCSKGKTPLHYLYETRSEKYVDQFLKAAKEDYNIEFDLHAKDNDGLTPHQMTETYNKRSIY